MSIKVHKPLVQTGDIRILTLLPGPPDSPVQCHLTTTSLTSTPYYEVISYDRSQSPKTKDISINNTPFPVAQNVAAALHRLRLPSAPRQLWIDSICINQTDHVEKEQQVLLIGRILTQARHLCVWLGDPHLSLESPWWRQVWSVPEVVLSKRVLLISEKEEVVWEAFEMMGRGILKSKAPDEQAASFQELSRLRKRWTRGHRDFSVYQLLECSRRRECVDPTDKIHAFLCLEPSLGRFGIVPRYGDDVSTAEIYLDFAWKMIQRTGRLDVLNCVRGWRDSAPTDMDFLPSWVPNWAARTSMDAIPLLDWSEENPKYSAGNLMKAQIRETNDPKTLVLSGVRFDQVAQVGEPWHPEDKIPPVSRNGIAAFEQWERLALLTPLSCPYNGPEGRKEALWRTYVADAAGENCAPKQSEVFAECWYDRVGWSSTPKDATETERAWTKHMTELLNKARTTKNPLRKIKDTFDFSRHGKEEYKKFCRGIHDACAHRRLLVSKRGYIGLAPWNVQAEDVIAVLHGGRTPFLLRPGLEPGVYSLVGECFVYGIMAGEGLTWEHAIAAARDFRVV